MREAFRDLIEFERACGHDLSRARPGDGMTNHTYKLRRRLIREECDELLDALEAHDVAGIADGIADLCYVALGTAVRYGIFLPDVWDAVHAANLRKFGPGSRRDADSKILKPPDWVHPDVAAILAAQRPLAETCGNGG